MPRLRPLPANALTFLVIAPACLAVWYLLKPAPPSRIVMSTGVPTGAYAKFGHRYAEFLARDGIEVVLRPSAGAIENLERLVKEEVDVAFVQSGLSSADDRKVLVGLGSLYYEPLWVIHRGNDPLVRLTQLAGKRLGIGLPGSGTRALTMRMLSLNGIGPAQATLVEQDVRGMIDSLRRGDLDAVFLVLAPDSPLFADLLRTEGLHLMNMERALSYQRRLPELTRVALPSGVLDLERNIPEQATQIVAATANLVASEKLHPAVQYLLVRAAQSIHGEPDLLSEPQTFPTISTYQEFEVPEEIHRLYREGPPFLYRHLPFWLANLIYRMWVAAIAAFAIFVTVTDWIPKLFRYTLNLRVGRNYLSALRLEDEIRQAGASGDWTRYRERLDALRRKTAALNMPLLLQLSKDELQKRLDDVERAIGQQRDVRSTNGSCGAPLAVRERDHESATTRPPDEKPPASGHA